MYAVIKTGGKQYRVKAGDLLVVEKLPGANTASTVPASDAMPIETPMVVSADQRKHLMDLVTDFYQEVSLQAKHASAWEIAMIASAKVGSRVPSNVWSPVPF